jgi:hypothetical protein
MYTLLVGMVIKQIDLRTNTLAVPYQTYKTSLFLSNVRSVRFSLYVAKFQL